MISLWMQSTLVCESFVVFYLLDLTFVVMIVSVVTITSVVRISTRLIVVIVLVTRLGVYTGVGE